MNVKPFSSSTRLVAWLAVLGCLTLAALAPAVASAAKSKNCAKEVVADWYGDGRVDKIFPLHCYDDAIRSLPVDVLDYSNAKEDILRALAFAKKGQKDPGDGGTGKPGTGTTPDETTGTGTGPTTTDPDATSTDSETVAGPGSDDIDTSGPSSVPIPLLVLGGLALLLLAAGGAGYLNRRRSAGADGPDAPA